MIKNLNLGTFFNLKELTSLEIAIANRILTSKDPEMLFMGFVTWEAFLMKFNTDKARKSNTPLEKVITLTKQLCGFYIAGLQLMVMKDKTQKYSTVEDIQKGFGRFGGSIRSYQNNDMETRDRKLFTMSRYIFQIHIAPYIEKSTSLIEPDFPYFSMDEEDQEFFNAEMDRAEENYRGFIEQTETSEEVTRDPRDVRQRILRNLSLNILAHRELLTSLAIMNSGPDHNFKN